MQRLTIDEMKQVELDLMDEFDRICREQSITYFLGYGSLLGAVRHGGFIPWDDDMDVVMFRSEYERFIEGFNEWKSDDRFALSFCRDGESIYPFVKLVDTTTRVYENFVDKDIATGVWIDLFPLEEVDPTDNGVFRRNARIGLLRSFIVADPAVGSSGLVRLVKRIVCPFVAKLDASAYARKLDENARCSRASSSDFVADVIGEGKPHFRFRKELFDPIEMNFENRKYFAPRGYEEILKIQYGDWQTPLPKQAREVHVFEAYRL